MIYYIQEKVKSKVFSATVWRYVIEVTFVIALLLLFLLSLTLSFSVVCPFI